MSRFTRSRGGGECGGGGGGRIRTHGALQHSGFQDRRLKPLGHPSALWHYRIRKRFTSPSSVGVLQGVLRHQGNFAVRLDAPVQAVEPSLFAAPRTYQQGPLYSPSTTTPSYVIIGD